MVSIDQRAHAEHVVNIGRTKMINEGRLTDLEQQRRLQNKMRHLSLALIGIPVMMQTHKWDTNSFRNKTLGIEFICRKFDVKIIQLQH